MFSHKGRNIPQLYPMEVVQVNGTPGSPPNGEMSDFEVICTGSGEFRRNSDAENLEEISLRMRQLVLENKELRENAQRNTETMGQQYEALKNWREQEAEKLKKIISQYNQAKDIITSVREENIRLKHKLEYSDRQARQNDAALQEGHEEVVRERDLLQQQMIEVQQENEELKKKLQEALSLSQSTSSPKKMTSSSMEVNVASHGDTETQTEQVQSEAHLQEIVTLRTQVNQSMLDLESLQKLKDEIEQQKTKAEQERDEFVSRLNEKEDVIIRILREKREVVAMNNQLNTEIDRLVTENQHLWDSEKERTESLRNYDTVQDFMREVDQRLDVQLPSIPPEDTEVQVHVKAVDKVEGHEQEEEVKSGGVKSGEGLVDRSKTIQQMLLQLQEQQEENQKVYRELDAKANQVTQLQSDLDKQKAAVREKEAEFEQAKAKFKQDIDDLVQLNADKLSRSERMAGEEKQRLEGQITALEGEMTQKQASLNELKTHLENTTEIYQKQISSLNEVNEKRKLEIADQTQLLATMNNSHRLQIEEMRREILRLSETADDKHQKSISESQQVELLQQQVNTLMVDLRGESTRLEAKTQMCLDYKAEADRLNLELQRQQTKNNEIVEAMRLQIGSLQSKLLAAEMEVEKKRHDIDDMRRNHDQLLADYEDLLQRHDRFTKTRDEVETQYRHRMTQLQTESINRQEQCKNLEDEVREKQEEIEDLFRRIRTQQTEAEQLQLYQVQAEVYKEDFGREREARERAHAELAEIHKKLEESNLERQRLEGDLQRFSQQNIAQMQRNDQYAILPQQYPPAGVRGYPYPGASPEGIDNFGFRQPNLGAPPAGSPNRRPSPSRQPEVHKCPKCQREFPDLDMLQIHIFDCLDQ